MTVNVTERVPCRYVVARYVDDDVRDEAINLGVIVQSQQNFDAQCKFITQYRYKSLSTTASINNDLLKEILEKIERDVSSVGHNEKLLEHIITRYGGKIRFTGVKAALAEDLVDETQMLFERYVSIKHKEPYRLPITHYGIKRNVSGHLRSLGKKIRTSYKIQGLTTTNKFDVALKDKSRIFHAISFQELRAVERTKLFDWAVKDSIARHEKILRPEMFSAIITEPSPNKPKFDMMMVHYKEGKKILDDNGYTLVQFDRDDDSWKRNITKLVNA